MSEIEAEVVIEEHEAGTEEQEALKNDALVALRLPKEIVALIDRVVEEGKLGSRSAVIRTWVCGLFEIPGMEVGELVSMYTAFTKFLQLRAEPLEHLLYLQFMYNLSKWPEEDKDKYAEMVSSFISGYYIAQSKEFQAVSSELEQGLTHMSEARKKELIESFEIVELKDRVQQKIMETIHSLSGDIAGRLDAVSTIVISELDK